MTRLNLFDSHAHVECEAFDEDRDAVLAEIEANLAGVINPGCDRVSSQQAMELAARYPFMWAAVGWHPEEINRMVDEDLALLEKWCADPKVVAIGEIGLDYYHDEGVPHELQKQRFVQQLHLAKKVGLPVIIHDREAHGDCLELIRQEGQGVRGVFHCYSGSLETARELLKMGWYLGFGGTSTYKNARKVVEVLKWVPEDRLLFETDSPYLTPVPYRGKKNFPTYTELVVENAAKLRHQQVLDLIEISTKNLKNLFFKVN